MGQVKGTLFVDYVRMLRAKKGVDWARYLAPQDMPYLEQQISPEEWYPMAAFERMGLAILAEVAQSDMGLVRHWGRIQIDWLACKRASASSRYPFAFTFVPTVWLRPHTAVASRIVAVHA